MTVFLRDDSTENVLNAFSYYIIDKPLSNTDGAYYFSSSVSFETLATVALWQEPPEGNAGTVLICQENTTDTLKVDFGLEVQVQTLSPTQRVISLTADQAAIFWRI